MITIAGFGEILAVASLIAAIGCLLWVGLLASRVIGRARKLERRPIVLALAAAGEPSERIGKALGSLDGIGTRIESIVRDLTAASVASAHVAACVATVASATEGLLDATMPSMRSAFSDR